MTEPRPAPIEIASGQVRIGDATATVTPEGGAVRLAITPPGDLRMPTYAARAYAEQILRACREADLDAAGDLACIPLLGLPGFSAPLG